MWIAHVDHPCGWQILPWPARKVTEIKRQLTISRQLADNHQTINRHITDNCQTIQRQMNDLAGNKVRVNSLRQSAQIHSCTHTKVVISWSVTKGWLGPKWRFWQMYLYPCFRGKGTSAVFNLLRIHQGQKHVTNAPYPETRE